MPKFLCFYAIIFVKVIKQLKDYVGSILLIPEREKKSDILINNIKKKKKYYQYKKLFNIKIKLQLFLD